MTVVLAIRCADGLVPAADSRITDADRGLSYPAHKQHHLGDYVVWGGSGARVGLAELEGMPDANPTPIVEAVGVGPGAHQLDEKEIEEARARERRWVDLEQRALDELVD